MKNDHKGYFEIKNTDFLVKVNSLKISTFFENSDKESGFIFQKNWNKTSCLLSSLFAQTKCQNLTLLVDGGILLKNLSGVWSIVFILLRTKDKRPKRREPQVYLVFSLFWFVWSSRFFSRKSKIRRAHFNPSHTEPRKVRGGGGEQYWPHHFRIGMVREF